ncbi:hypothetical protein HRW23_19625 [Streptomyces lunaelactis]|nr:hypothetical protein [Streptomyces lunaelactis]NUK08875.1 hypothetical protein [Streptomyces lunaelactis]NUK15957.1 hypothetical protein [Streptomyces lunaelactis]NUK34764.1 hypothetical protein [Streptomyces lunaelactis]NUK41483.1 hypothetical protein [Streptomyces lunaelactis]
MTAVRTAQLGHHQWQLRLPEDQRAERLRHGEERPQHIAYAEGRRAGEREQFAVGGVGRQDGATVRQEDAADAGGLLVTVTQLGQVIGVAAFGTLFLNRLTAPGSKGSADALWVSVLALAAASILGSVAGLVRNRR